MLSRLKRDLTMAEAARAPGGARVDLALVADMVPPGSRVLDIGAGDGDAVGDERLSVHLAVDGRGPATSERPGADRGRRGHTP